MNAINQNKEISYHALNILAFFVKSHNLKMLTFNAHVTYDTQFSPFSFEEKNHE